MPFETTHAEKPRWVSMSVGNPVARPMEYLLVCDWTNEDNKNKTAYQYYNTPEQYKILTRANSNKTNQKKKEKRVVMFIMFWSKWGNPVDRVNHVDLVTVA